MVKYAKENEMEILLNKETSVTAVHEEIQTTSPKKKYKKKLTDKINQYTLQTKISVAI